MFLHPSVLACGVFTISSLLMALNGDRWRYDISFVTLIYILIALVVFSIGVRIGEKKNTSYYKCSSSNYHYYFYIRKQVLVLVSLLSILVTYIYFQHQYAASVALGNNLGIAGMIFYLRRSTVFDAENEVLQLSTTLNIGLSFVRAASNLCLFILISKILNKEKDWFHYIVPIMCLMANVVLATGRGGFIGLVSAVIFDIFIFTRMQKMYSKNKKILKYSALLVAIFFVVFFVLGTLTGKDEALNFNDTVAIYAGSGILCFDYMLIHGWDMPAFIGMNTFKGLYGMIGRFVGGIPSMSNHSEMVRWSDYSANIYTSFSPYIRDFGIIGSIFILFFVGILFGCLWNRYLKKEGISLLTVIYGGMFGYALCMFSIAERVLSEFIALNVFVQLIILQVLLTYFVKKRKYEFC